MLYLPSPCTDPEKVMMAAASISNATIARAAQLVGFAVVAAALAVVSWHGTSLNLPGVGQFAGVIGSGFLGGIINPLVKTLTHAAATVTVTAGQQGDTSQVTQEFEAVQNQAAVALRKKSDLMWDIAVGIGAAAIVVAALALMINGERHVNAAAALTALATAFGALFVDTSRITHTLNGTTESVAP